MKIAAQKIARETALGFKVVSCGGNQRLKGHCNAGFMRKAVAHRTAASLALNFACKCRRSQRRWDHHSGHA